MWSNDDKYPSNIYVWSHLDFHVSLMHLIYSLYGGSGITSLPVPDIMRCWWCSCSAAIVGCSLGWSDSSWSSSTLLASMSPWSSAWLRFGLPWNFWTNDDQDSILLLTCKVSLWLKLLLARLAGRVQNAMCESCSELSVDKYQLGDKAQLLFICTLWPDPFHHGLKHGENI